MNVYPFLFIVSFCSLTSNAWPIKDSPISRIVLISEPYTSQQIMNSRNHFKRVLAPVNMEIVPQVNLKKAEIVMGGKGTPLNFVEGAYPVYYMLGSANGRFNGKITLLK